MAYYSDINCDFFLVVQVLHVTHLSVLALCTKNVNVIQQTSISSLETDTDEFIGPPLVLIHLDCSLVKVPPADNDPPVQRM